MQEIVLMQETHSNNGCHNQWKSEWEGNIWFDHGTSRKNGVAIMIRKGCQHRVIEVYRSEVYQGRFLAIKVEIANEILLILNIYTPNQDAPGFFETIFECLDKTGVDRKIIGGDFNLVLQSIDRKGKGTHCHQQAIKKINSMCEEMQLVNI